MLLSAACIPESFDDWRNFVARMSGVANAMHLDVCDGRFVGRRSWPLQGDGGEWGRIVGQDEGLPGWKGNDFEADLMVSNPASIFDEFVDAGFSRVIVHWETLGQEPAAALEALSKSARADLWLAAGPGTDPADYLEALDFAAGFQAMGIARVGFQGEPFDDRALHVVRVIRAAHPALPIAVDGGVAEDTAAEIAAAGATKLVVGSALIKSEDPNEAAARIRAAALGN